MKRVYIIFVLALLVVASGVYVLWPDEREITNYPPNGDTIVAFGDSLVAGVGDDGGDGFVDDLEARFDITVHNESVAGDTTRKARERMDNVLAHDPDVVILLLGGNDALKRVEPETTRRNLATIIERLQQNSTVVILLGVRGGIFGGGYAEMYEDLADTYGTFYVSDVLDGLLGDPDLMSDRIHPNEDGYARIADRIAPILKKNLDAAGSPSATSR